MSAWNAYVLLWLGWCAAFWYAVRWVAHALWCPYCA